ncbi:hypothetical protein [Moraxella oblonga]|uniref:hypothetical protein n=1 Tax=Moraxella oblonga TaxID=200413 RepID=UPI00082B7514|nr:hypothetical protein [Moraxella oblonga]
MNYDYLYKGDIFVQRVNVDDNNYYTWVEIRYDCNLYQFKMRISSFIKEDIDNEWDPNYDKVGKFKFFESLESLNDELNEMSIDINKFYDSSKSRYPL